MSKSTYQSSHNMVYSSKYHLVWCPKYRRQVLRGSVENRLKSVIAEICDEYHAQVIGLEVMPDHVHLLVEVDPSFGVSRLVRLIKGRSSRILRQEFPHLRQLPSLWTNCQWPLKIPHRRPREFPRYGHGIPRIRSQNSPDMAIISPQIWPRNSPRTATEFPSLVRPEASPPFQRRHQQDAPTHPQ